jgi:DNA polymerase III delta prime subunit
MDTIIDTYKKTGTLHHACLIEGEKEELFDSLCDMLEKEMNFPTKGNPDFWYGEFDTFGIGDGREIKELQTRKAVSGGMQIFIITAKSFTTEAQNSLLKVFEEPTEGTYFFIITPNAEILLLTLRSRMLVVRRTGLRQNIEDRSFAGCINLEEFLKSSKARRLELLKGIIEEKDKGAAISFLNELEQTLYRKFGSRASKSGQNIFKEIIKCKKYLSGRAPSVKMMLEHISLIIS